MLGDPPVPKGTPRVPAALRSQQKTISAHKVENSLSNLTRCGSQEHPGAGNEAERWNTGSECRMCWVSSPEPRKRGQRRQNYPKSILFWPLWTLRPVRLLLCMSVCLCVCVCVYVCISLQFEWFNFEGTKIAKCHTLHFKASITIKYYCIFNCYS